MHTLRRLLSALAIIALLSTLITAGLATSASAGYERPRVGQCRALTLEQFNAASNNSAPVDCTEPHTARTVAVYRKPRDLGWKSSAPFLKLDRKCYRGLSTALGRNNKVRHLSNFMLTYYIPTKAQRRDGRRWMRCDVTLPTHNSLTPLPSSTVPMLPLSGALPDTLRRCLTGKRLRLTTCNESHRYRAVSVFKNRGKYPSDKARFKEALAKCKSRTSTSAYAWSWPWEFQWLAGDKTVVCYNAHGDQLARLSASGDLGSWGIAGSAGGRR